MTRQAKSVRNISDIHEGLEYLGNCDPRLLPVIDAVDKVPLRLLDPDFKGLASIIVSQQVSKASAAAIFGRLCEQEIGRASCRERV